MPYYRQVGDVPRKRHTQFRLGAAARYHPEELMGQEGFSDTSACSTTATRPRPCWPSRG